MCANSKHDSEMYNKVTQKMGWRSWEYMVIRSSDYWKDNILSEYRFRLLISCLFFFFRFRLLKMIMIKPRKLPTQSRRSINNKSIEERKQNPKKDVNSEKAGNVKKKQMEKLKISSRSQSI